MKFALGHWSKIQLGNPSQRVGEVRQLLDLHLEHLDAHPYDSDLQRLLREAQAALSKILTVEEAEFQQRSRCNGSNWVTTIPDFFTIPHVLVVIGIGLTILCEDGSLTRDINQIKAMGLCYYSKLLGPHQQGWPQLLDIQIPSLDASDREHATSDFSKNEIKEVVFSSNGDKALGLDGFTALLFQCKGGNLISIVRKVVFDAAVYKLWAERNRRVFRNEFFSPSYLSRKILETVQAKLNGEELKAQDGESNRNAAEDWNLHVDDLERPLVSEDLDLVPNQNSELVRDHVLEESCLITEGSFNSPRTHGLIYKQRLPSADAQSIQGMQFISCDSLVLDVISDPSEDLLVGHTLKNTLLVNRSFEERKHLKKGDISYGLTLSSGNDNYRESVAKDIADQRSSLSLEVISGPSRGLRCSLQSTNTSRLPLTLGRVSPSDLLLKDSEVSGKHAHINWNSNKLKWELVDMGSLNGTLLNSQAVIHPVSGSRHWSEPIELASGDIITVGTKSKVFVRITPQDERQIPFGVGMASDPMAVRRGGKKLPMEDVYYYQWPLPGVEQFGLFGICDGHGGAGAAKSASKLVFTFQVCFHATQDKISLGNLKEYSDIDLFQSDAFSISS
ncbi:hypothetical protein HHK36_020632 [Tetracentron sinense]|uniref:FHA domain-containing protein n=1 Tax=Tetracentron sinense TaxID=13715 RepID=A0A834YS18_TETSI|nr:hypothetical protein HHK36_020632 [Tetracentron sinense]